MKELKRTNELLLDLTKRTKDLNELIIKLSRIMVSVNVVNVITLLVLILLIL